MRPVPQIAVDFVKGAEGCELTAYRDSRGVLTIGWGHTGAEVVAGLTITPAQAISYLIVDLALAARRLATVVSDAAIQGLTEHEYAALLSFVFNLGADRTWQIWGLLNRGSLDAVPVQMMRFDKEHDATGKVVEVPGLYNRRAAEVTIWKTADVAAAVTVAQAAPVAPPPSSYTVSASTPPTPTPVKPLSRQKSFVGACCTAVGAAALPLVQNLQGVGKTVSDSLAPYLGQSEVLQHLNGELTLGLAALAVAVPFFVWLKTVEARS